MHEVCQNLTHQAKTLYIKELFKTILFNIHKDIKQMLNALLLGKIFNPNLFFIAINQNFPLNNLQTVQKLPIAILRQNFTPVV